MDYAIGAIFCLETDSTTMRQCRWLKSAFAVSMKTHLSPPIITVQSPPLYIHTFWGTHVIVLILV